MPLLRRPPTPPTTPPTAPPPPHQTAPAPAPSYSDRAHGLDLSFVTHIFLLEPIHDAALMEQVVSRAHRLGATGAVTIETVHIFQDARVFDTEDDEEGQEGEAAGGGTNGGGGGGGGGGKAKRREKHMPKGICDLCYRSFEPAGNRTGKEMAALHEPTCERNPANLAAASQDAGNMLSVYKEIRPPAPLVGSGP